MKIVYRSETARGEQWAAWLSQHAPDIQFHLWPDTGDDNPVDFLVAWQPPEGLNRHFPHLKALFSVGAGADQFDYGALPADLPVVRMIEPGLTQGMVEYITFAALALHRGMPRYLHQQQHQQWLAHPSMRAGARRVGVMGLGELGTAALRQLQALGFECGGWSRTPHVIAGVACWHGPQQLAEFLARTDILICLLPLTDATRGLLNAELFDALPKGAMLIQAGRGPQLHPHHLLAALESGQVQAAILDVTDPEPLPPEHPLWRHPSVWITPHIASQTQGDSAVSALLENIRRWQRGEPMHGVIERNRGY